MAESTLLRSEVVSMASEVASEDIVGLWGVSKCIVWYAVKLFSVALNA